MKIYFKINLKTNSSALIVIVSLMQVDSMTSHVMRTRLERMVAVTGRRGLGSVRLLLDPGGHVTGFLLCPQGGTPPFGMTHPLQTFR